MRVLVLRPKPEGVRTARALDRSGHEALLAPVLEIAPVEGARVPRWRLTSPYAAVIAASPHAFSLLDCESRARLAEIPAMLVGARGARAAEKAGLRVLRPVYRTARELAAALPEHAPPGRLLYLAGRDRRPEIEQALRRGKRRFVLVEVYAAIVAPELPGIATRALRRREIDAVLHYSPRSAKAFVELAREKRILRRAVEPVQLCVSAAVAAPLVEAGAKRLELAASPDERSLFALLPKPTR